VSISKVADGDGEGFSSCVVAPLHCPHSLVFLAAATANKDLLLEID